MTTTGIEIATPRPSAFEQALGATGVYRLARRRLRAFLEPIRRGHLRLRFGDGEEFAFGGVEPGPRAVMEIRSARFYSRVALSGDLGFAESYMAGEWDTPDLAALLLLLVENRDLLGDLEVRTSGVRTWLATRLHRRRANTLEGSRRNIADHYDLGNSLFETFLDPGMTYSCALFESCDESLERAQERKLDRMLDLVGARPGLHLLEIGCGWGSLAQRAVELRGCRMTCLTLSKRQKEWAERRFAARGIADRVEVRLEDYRHITGPFDGIVSIEMLEAVGEPNLGTYFASCERLLRPGAAAAIQVITIDDAHYDEYRTRADFIQSHVFPGGHLPSPAKLRSVIAAHTRLQLERVDSIGSSYAPTLAAWRERFLSAAGRIGRMGYPPEFVRKWLYYFCYCEAGFLSGALDDLQFVVRRPIDEEGEARVV